MGWAVLAVLLSVAVRDDYGNSVALAAPATRIVALSPHLTELVYAAGAGERLVGAVDYSDYPAAARALPRVGSAEHINVESVLALRPDLLVAWPQSGTKRTIDRLAELGVPVFRSEPRELEDIAATLERLGALAGTSGPAALAAADFRARRNELEKRYAGRPTVRVFYLVWDRPLQTVNGDHVISKVIRLCGGENVFASAPLIAPEVNAEAVLSARPDVVLTSNPAAQVPPGIDRKRVRYVPPDLIQRHTPRLMEGAEQVCAALDAVRAARS